MMGTKLVDGVAVPLSAEEEQELAASRPERPPSKEVQEAARRVAYVAEADPLFFKAQRGEATLEEWQAKVDEIKALYPYPAE